MYIRKLDRYFGGELVKGFLLALFAFIIIFLSVTLNDAMKIETKEPKQLLYLYLLTTIPSLIALSAPAAIMFSVCFTVAQFTSARELVAVFASGVSFYRAIAFILGFAFLVSILLVAFQEFVVVPSNQISTDYLTQYKKSSRKKLDVVWQRSFRGKQAFYFMQYLNAEKKEVLGGFHILFFKPNTNPLKPVRMIEAKTAKLVDNYDWQLQLVRETFFNDDLSIQDVKLHVELPVHLTDSIDFFLRPRRDPQEMTLKELNQEIKVLENDGFSATLYQVRFHSTIAFPFMCFIVAVVGSVAGNMGSLRSGGPLILSLLLSTATIFFYMLSIRIGQNLGENDIVSPFVAGWAATIIFGVIAIGLVIHHRR